MSSAKQVHADLTSSGRQTDLNNWNYLFQSIGECDNWGLDPGTQRRVNICVYSEPTITNGSSNPNQTWACHTCNHASFTIVIIDLYMRYLNIYIYLFQGKSYRKRDT